MEMSYAADAGQVAVDWDDGLLGFIGPFSRMLYFFLAGKEVDKVELKVLGAWDYDVMCLDVEIWFVMLLLSQRREKESSLRKGREEREKNMLLLLGFVTFLCACESRELLF